MSSVLCTALADPSAYCYVQGNFSNYFTFTFQLSGLAIVLLQLKYPDLAPLKLRIAIPILVQLVLFTLMTVFVKVCCLPLLLRPPCILTLHRACEGKYERKRFLCRHPGACAAVWRYGDSDFCLMCGCIIALLCS
jgi:hypothetical protein